MRGPPYLCPCLHFAESLLASRAQIVWVDYGDPVEVPWEQKKTDGHLTGSQGQTDYGFFHSAPVVQLRHDLSRMVLTSSSCRHVFLDYPPSP
jgi:hypothetical protein